MAIPYYTNSYYQALQQEDIQALYFAAQNAERMKQERDALARQYQPPVFISFSVFYKNLKKEINDWLSKGVKQ